MQTNPDKDKEASLVLSKRARDVWVTGVGLVSSQASGASAHWDALSAGPSRRNVDTVTYAPYPVHRLAEICIGDQIRNKADLRQMGRWQQIGVFAAGQALDDAHLKGDVERLADIDLVVAAGNGERDQNADATILRTLRTQPHVEAPLISALQSALRPTLYLAELSNLLAGNISIIHGVTKSSRTFKGEEQAGVAAVQDAARRIAEGTSRIALVGGACNAERSDLHLSLELCNALWHDDIVPISRRTAGGGGIILGSVGAFVVLEDAEHARNRGVRPYARVKGVASSRLKFAAPSDGPPANEASFQSFMSEVSRSVFDVLSGASGVQAALEREMAFIGPLEQKELARRVRFYGDAVGHGMEAHFPTGIALAAIALSNRSFYPPLEGGQGDCSVPERLPTERVLVTGFGHWRGAGAALLEAVEGAG